MKTFNPNIPPPNGFKFLNEDGTTIVGNGWDRLERNVIAYRKRLGQSTDNVMEMIVEQICALAPGFCKDGSERQGERQVKESLKAMVMAWLGKRAGEARDKPLDQVDSNTAKIRAQTCVGCPKRNPADMGCSACQSNMRNLQNVALGGQKSVGEKLGACSVTKEFLPVAVHIFDPPAASDGLPDYCWRKKA